jgi:hypothetical protein
MDASSQAISSLGGFSVLPRSPSLFRRPLLARAKVGVRRPLALPPNHVFGTACERLNDAISIHASNFFLFGFSSLVGVVCFHHQRASTRSLGYGGYG